MLVLDALGSPIRRQILALLQDEPQNVVSLADQFEVSRPAISRHLRLLHDAGLVERHSRGRENTYAVRPEGFAAVEEYLSAFWDEALFRYRMVTENLEKS